MQMIKFFKIYPLILLIFLLCFSCKSGSQDTNVKITYTDDIGNQLTLDKKPGKIVSLAPGITETIYFLKLDSLLYGVTDYCNYPPEAKKKKSVGDMLSPNLEVISQIKPDIVFMTIEGNTKNTYQAIKNLGINVYVSAPRNFPGIIKMMSDIQMLCGRGGEPERIKEDFIKNINRIGAAADSIKKPALILVSVKPPVTFNKNTFLNDVFRSGGFGNLYENEPADYPVLNYEDILMKNPGYIMIISDTSEFNRKNLYGEIKKNMEYSDAVKNGKIFFLYEDIFSRPGPRIYEAVEKLKSFN